MDDPITNQNEFKLTPWSHWFLILCIALFWTAWIASTSLKLDDSAYLQFAQIWKENFWHPYGEPPFGAPMNWYGVEQPAFTILSPPVIPAWLMTGVTLFGSSIVALKLWMFPWALLFCSQVYRVAHNWNCPHPIYLMMGVVFSPAIFCGLNFMLDVPAAALALLGFNVVLKSHPSRWQFVKAGLLFALAFQTKYTSMTLMAFSQLYSLHQHGRKSCWLSVTAITIIAFWEGYLYSIYNASHFIWHLQHSAQPAAVGLTRLARFQLLQPLIIQLGLNCAFLMFILAFHGWLWLCILIDLLILAMLFGLKIDAGILGFIVCSCICILLLRRFKQFKCVSSYWLLVWLLFELVGYFVLSPFPAFRRIIPVTIPLILLVFNCSQNSSSRWWIGSLFVHLAFFAIPEVQEDRLIATATKSIQQAISPKENEQVYFHARWGLRSHLQQAGYLPVHSKVTFQQGDFLLLVTNEFNFALQVPNSIQLKDFKCCANFQFDSTAKVTTFSRLGGGTVPIAPAKNPLLEIAIYQYR